MKYGVKKRQIDVNEADDLGAKRKRPTKAQASHRAEDHVPAKSSAPQLPPEIRETDRMLAVQRWINNIPRDAKSWAQVNHDKIVILDNPFDFPVLNHARNKCPFNECYECLHLDSAKLHLNSDDAYSLTGGKLDSGSGDANYLPGNMMGSKSNYCGFTVVNTNCQSHSKEPGNNYPHTNQYSKNHRISPTVHHYASGQNCQDQGQTQRQPLKMYNTGTMGVVNRVHHIDPWSGASIDASGRQLTSQQQSYPDKGIAMANGVDYSFKNAEEEDGSTVNKRFYSDKEIKTLVKCFWDYFQKGDLPTLKEIRTRLSRMPHQLTRGTNSIRMKLKRLQSNGSWANFNCS